MIVVIPFNPKDMLACAKNLQWMAELDGLTSYRALLSYPEGTDAAQVERIKSLASKAFSVVDEFQYPETEDRHWPAGANWSWQQVARYIPMVTDFKGNSSPFKKIYPAGTPWLWLEADAVPLKKGWLDTLRDEYQRGGKPFMGHIVKQMGHMNGVGVYPNDASKYGWKAFVCTNAAWDVVMREETIDHTHPANHLIQHCWVLINGQPSHNGDGPVATFRDTGEMHRLLEPDAVLFHRCKDGSLIDCLMQKLTSLYIAFNAGATRAELAESIALDPIPIHQPVKGAVSAPDYPKTEIFIVTYHKDAEFLKYSLYSIKKFCHGFSGLTVVCPERDVEVIEPICEKWGPEDFKLDIMEEPDGRGMLAHMAVECMADTFVSGVDYILHFDSDCIFTEPVTPEDYFDGGKPVLLIEEYERFIDRHPGVLKWKEGTEAALGRAVKYEFMRRLPIVHHIATYPLVRSAVEARHKKPFWDWAISGKNSYPQSWSDYNLIGAVAWEKRHGEYRWLDCATEVRPKDKIVQFWSHGGLDRPTDTGAFVPETPRTIIKRILGV